MALSLWQRFSVSNFGRFAAGLLISGGGSILVVPWENLADSAGLTSCNLALSLSAPCFSRQLHSSRSDCLLKFVCMGTVDWHIEAFEETTKLVVSHGPHSI